MKCPEACALVTWGFHAGAQAFRQEAYITMLDQVGQYETLPDSEGNQAAVATWLAAADLVREMEL